MHRALLRYVVCPFCQGDLHVAGSSSDPVESGELRCSSGHSFPIILGVPHLLRDRLDDVTRRTAENFGDQWTRFDEHHDAHRQQFLDWIAPLGPEDFKGKVTVELGCGMGRHAALAGEFEAEAHLAVDVSDAVFVAQKFAERNPRVHVIRADLFQLPFRRIADLAFSVGVLHHTADPHRAFQALLGCVKPGGTFAAWVYGRENNGWIVHLVNPVREAITSRLPSGALYRLSQVLSWAAVIPVVKLLYAPLARMVPSLATRLPYGQYLSYVGKFPSRQIHGIVHDHLSAPVAHYLGGAELERWLEHAGAEDPVLRHHNGMSWLVSGRLTVRSLESKRDLESRSRSPERELSSAERSP